MSFWGPVLGSLIGGGLGLLGAREQNRAQERAIDRAADRSLESQEIEIWPGAAPHAERALSEAARLYGLGGFAPQANPLELLGRANTLGYAEETLPGLIGAAQQSWLSGLQPGLNPYVGSMIQAAQQDLAQDYARNVMPAIADRAQAVGGYGGSRQGVAQGIASEGLLEAMGDVSTNLLGQAYRDQLGQQRAAWGAAPAMTGLGFLPSQTQQQMGGLYREDAARPAQNLQGYVGTLGPFWQFRNTGINVPASIPQSPIGGAMTGAGLGFGVGQQYGGSIGDWLGGIFSGGGSGGGGGNPAAGYSFGGWQY